MASFGIILPTGTPANGRPRPIAATATPGTEIHTAIAGDVNFDEVYVWAANVTNAAASLTLEWGGTGTANHLIESYSIPANSPLILIAPGLRVNGGVRLAAYASVASAINVVCNVNAIR